MTNPLEKPRQKGYSNTPQHETNPRRWARDRCVNSVNALERVMTYMGELIEKYKIVEDDSELVFKTALNILQDIEVHEASISDFLRAYKALPEREQIIGRYPEVILQAAIIIQSATTLSDSVMDLRNGI